MALLVIKPLQTMPRKAYLTFNQNYVFNGQVIGGATNLQRINSDLRWESKTTTNIGLDFGLFQNSITGSIDYFVANAKDLLLEVPIALSAGNTGSEPLDNVGQVQNKGLEIALRYEGKIGEANYQISGNGTFLRNEIIELVADAGNLPIFGINQVIRNAVGGSMASFFTLKSDGIFQNQAEIEAHGVQPDARPGDVRYIDINGDGQINFDDRTVVGNAIPDFEFGLNLKC